MANLLIHEKQVLVINSLVEGLSIRSIERMTGIHRDTIMRLGVRIGESCNNLLDQKMRNLEFKKIQIDEIWGFVGKKQKNTRSNELNAGDTWTYVAMDIDTKVVPCFRVGKRDQNTTNEFIDDLAMRMKNKIQISSDGLKQYVEAIEKSFGPNVDYGQIVKTYSDKNKKPNNLNHERFIKKRIISGYPHEKDISTSYIERQNLTMRMHIRRLTRKTNAFSKKLDNFIAAIALHFAYYNFVRSHMSLRMTPAMAAGITSTFWSIDDLIEMSNY